MENICNRAKKKLILNYLENITNIVFAVNRELLKGIFFHFQVDKLNMIDNRLVLNQDYNLEYVLRRTFNNLFTIFIYIRNPIS